MNPHTTKSHIRTTLLALVCGALLAGLLILIFTKKEPTRQTVQNDPTPVQATLTGTYLCLPHRDTSGPQTEECMAGLKTDDGTYYALDLNLMSQGPISLASGDRISAQGVITPVEMLSSNQWQNYPIVGIFSATSFTQELQ